MRMSVRCCIASAVTSRHCAVSASSSSARSVTVVTPSSCIRRLTVRSFTAPVAVCSVFAACMYAAASVSSTVTSLSEPLMRRSVSCTSTCPRQSGASVLRIVSSRKVKPRPSRMDKSRKRWFTARSSTVISQSPWRDVSLPYPVMLCIRQSLPLQKIHYTTSRRTLQVVSRICATSAFSHCNLDTQSARCYTLEHPRMFFLCFSPICHAQGGCNP